LFTSRHPHTAQGFGTRKLCKTLITQGSVTIKGRTAIDPTEVIVPEDGMSYTVDEEEWEYRQPAYVMLNKPKGYECSQKPGAHPSVMDLLPDPFRGKA
jgi:16S rRNA pseudouridine516 synthase